MFHQYKNKPHLKYIAKKIEEDNCGANFLLSASKYVNRLSSNVLKSHMSILCNNFLHNKNISLIGVDKKNECCPYCMSFWEKGNCFVKILPGPKKGKRTQKILKKFINNKKLANIETKILDRYFANKMQVKCLICQKVSNFTVGNAKRELYSMIRSRNLLSLVEKRKLEEEDWFRKTKKRKLRDNYHGLNPVAVEQFRSVSVPDQVHEVQPAQRKPPMTFRRGAGNNDDVEMEYEHRPRNIHYPHAAQMHDSTQRRWPKRKYKRDNRTLGPKSPAPVPFDYFQKPHSMLYTRPDRTVVPNSDRYSNRDGCSLPKRRRLSKWKNLVNEEETRPQATNSLRHFLSGL